MTETRQRLAAILVADASGYSRLMSQDDRATVDALDASREVFRTHVAANGGQVIDMAGDSVLAVFDTASGAVLAAMAVQEQLQALATEVSEERRMHFRIGIHLGDLIEKHDGSVYGDGVNIAARLQAMAEPGGVTASDSVRTAVRGKLRVGFDDQGEQPVKNMAVPVRAWRLRPASEADFASATAPAPLFVERRRFVRTHPLPQDKLSIAVLPFTNMSGEADQAYFADGMVEDIITELSRFSRLFVIARNTSFTYQGRKVDVKQVASELGVHFVLEGSVRKAGERVRVTAQLVDGGTGRHIWAERYEDTLTDMFELQERITRQVVATMVPEIEAEEMRLLSRGERRFSEADDLAWRAAKAMSDAMFGGLPDSTLDALELAGAAIASDRECQMAWYVLTNCHIWRVFMAWTPDRAGSLAAARSAADELMRLAPNDSRSVFQRGIVESMAGEFSSSMADLRRAHQLNPNDATALFFLSFTEAAAGNIARAKELADLALRISPRDRWVSTAHLARAVCAFIERDMQALHDWADLAIQSQATHPIRRVLMIVFAAETGDAPLLRKHLERLQKAAPHFIASLFNGDYRPLHQSEHMEMLLASLRKAGLG
jgi:adenylate cyclase